MRSQNIKLFTALLGVFAAVGLYGANFQPLMKLEYEYSRNGKISARIINGVRQNYRYDKRGQLLGVYDKNGLAVEEYVYDPAGNILKKTLNGKTTTYTYDNANQLVSSVCDGKVTKYEYDAAGRLVKEGDKTYSYIGLDKIESVTEGGHKLSSFTYHIDGQLAARIGMESREDFTWDGLALIQRNNVNYVNEPAVTGGNPILANDSVLLNDMLGTTLGVKDGDQFASISRDAFGMTENTSSENFFTGKPHVGEMGYVFLFRNYRADQGKWQTSDPLGYPDGWNNLAYCNNEFISSFDPLGLAMYELYNKEPVGGNGHSLPIVTIQNSDGSWSATGFDYGEISSGSTASDVKSFSGTSEDDVMQKLIKYYDKGGKYDQLTRWDANNEKSLDAYNQMSKEVAKDYNKQHNCLNITVAGLQAAGYENLFANYTPVSPKDFGDIRNKGRDYTKNLKIFQKTYE